MLETISDLFAFLKKEKKYWLAPIIIVLLLLGVLFIFSQNAVVAPLIYTLF